MRRMNQCPTIARLTTESALCPSALVNVTATASSAKARHAAHEADDGAKCARHDRKDHSAPEAIDEPADAERAGGAEQRRPQIQLRVLDAADIQIR